MTGVHFFLIGVIFGAVLMAFIDYDLIEPFKTLLAKFKR
jgi:nucleoside recognition membrane protein YjiH